MQQKQNAENDTNKFSWQLAMQFGFGVLHLSPKDFWSMTLVELNCALQIHYGHRLQTLGRNNLNSLMDSFPD